MSDARDVLPEPGYSTLLGWHVQALDLLFILRRRAVEEDLELWAWREADTSLRERIGGPEPDAAQRSALARAQREDAPDDHLLANRLAAFDRPPTDHELHESVASLEERLAQHPDTDGSTSAVLTRYRRWLASAVKTDEVTGLSADFVTAHWTDEVGDAQLGPVPISLAEARVRALRAATDQQLIDARRLKPGAQGDGAERVSTVLQFEAAQAQVARHSYARLVRVAYAHRDLPGAADLIALWKSGALRELIRADLRERTATS